jgi:hypothetical protein
MSEWDRMIEKPKRQKEKTAAPSGTDAASPAPSEAPAAIRWGFVVPIPLLDRMRDVCAHEGISMSELVRVAAAEYIDRLESKAGAIPPRPRGPLKKGPPFRK